MASMYCPQCATPNADDAKFCRSCGQELEPLALALGGKSAKPAKADKKKREIKTAEEWLEKHSEGVRNITTGVSLLLVSVLIGVALALFAPAEVPWILIWIVFFGWMACWGGIALGEGVGDVLVSKSRLRLLEAGKWPAVDPTPRQLSRAAEPATTAQTPASFGSSPPLSVTEGTTRHLDDSVER